MKNPYNAPHCKELHFRYRSQLLDGSPIYNGGTSSNISGGGSVEAQSQRMQGPWADNPLRSSSKIWDE